MVHPGRPQTTIWRMRIARWVTNATYTHSKYVIPLFHYNGYTNAPQCYDIRTNNWLSCHNRDGVSLLRRMNWIFQLNGLRFGKDRRIFVFLFATVLPRNQYVSRRSSDRPSLQLFNGFPLSSNKFWHFPNTPTCYRMLLMLPSRFKFTKIQPLALKWKLINLSFHIMYFSINQKLKFSAPNYKLLLSPFLRLHHTSWFSCYY